MRVLILTCNTGGGHNSSAQALRQAVQREGHTCDVADSLAFSSRNLSRFMAWGHTTMYRYLPGLFRFGYRFSEQHSGMLREGAAVYRLLTRGAETLYEQILREGYDAVLCTHVFAALLLGAAGKSGLAGVKTAFVSTDYTCSPGTAVSRLDRYFIPAYSLWKEFEDSGIPEEKLIVSGIPVRSEFYSRMSRPEAKVRVGVAPEHKHLLMMCGSMGCGPMKKLAGILAERMEENCELSVVCGTNERLRAVLEQTAGTKGNVHIYGFVEDINLLMDSADLYLTKPGGLSTSEAAAKELPMVCVDAVAGCESYNLRFFEELGGAVTASGVKELAGLCLELLRDPNRLETMAGRMRALEKRDAARCILKELQGMQTD